MKDPPTTMANESTPLVSATPSGVPSSSRSAVPSWLCPETNPAAWTVVNLFFFVWSADLVLEILFAGSPLDRKHGDQLYLAWNFTTTFVWCFEVGILVWYHGSNSAWSDRAQLLLAVYFLFDSIRLFRKWRNPDVDIEEELLDTIISMISYLWVLIVTALGWYKSINNASEEVEESTKEEDAPIEPSPREVEIAKPTEEDRAPVIPEEPSKEEATPPAAAETAVQFKKPETPKVKRKFPQFFRISEGKKGWGHKSQIGGLKGSISEDSVN